MFKSCGLKRSALSEVLACLVSATLFDERKRGDVGIYFYLSSIPTIYKQKYYTLHSNFDGALPTIILNLLAKVE